ncbi:MAG TPA: twin-arginine translocase subunit TatC [Tepidisphaeraceae bacterium]|jgi:sec-independent protein translocase protein TatC
MTTATAPSPEPKQKFDPDEFRMTIGEHLEELRKRLVYGLVGFGIVLVFFMVPPVGNRAMDVLCRPLTEGLRKHDLPAQVYVNGLTEGFMTYLQISIIAGLVFAGPWLIYQMWLFISAGLYPHERKAVTRYIPLSMLLFVAGVLFVYFLVLPLTVNFFLSFNADMPSPGGEQSVIVKDVKGMSLPVFDGDPENQPGSWIWYNRIERRIKLQLPAVDEKHPGEKRVIQFTTQNLLASHITLDDYIGFVFTFMLVFGVAFQLPLVILALVSIGIIETSVLRKHRKIVWFIMTIVAAIMAPGDIVTSMLALLIPLVFLYEFGIWLAEFAQKRRDQRQAAEDAATK